MKSTRPRISRLPSERMRALSPERYILAPLLVEKGSSGKLSSVFSGRAT
jgi:hypothetical protein